MFTYRDKVIGSTILSVSTWGDCYVYICAFLDLQLSR